MQKRSDSRKHAAASLRRDRSLLTRSQQLPGTFAVHRADLREAVGAEIHDLIDPEAEAEVWHLDFMARECRI